METNFDLKRRPWIFALYEDGVQREISLIKVFEDAPHIRELQGDIPQQVMPMNRLFLAILRRAHKDLDCPPSMLADWWKEMWDTGHFDIDAIISYLDKFPTEFNLFGERPFYQIPDLSYTESKEEGYNPVSEMIVDMPKPDKYLFSMRGKGNQDDMEFAAAARWLVFMQAYDPAGIKAPVEGNTHINKGKVYPPKNIPSTGWLGCLGGVFLQGENLFQTLMWNLVMYDAAQSEVELFGGKDDLPPWELPRVPGPDMCTFSSPHGPVNLDTWQSRRIRLVCNEAGDRVAGIIYCYGDALHPTDAYACEQMTAWRGNEAQQKKRGTAYLPPMPVTHDSSKALWRGLAPLLSLNEEQGTQKDMRPGVIRWMEWIRCQVGDRRSFPETLTLHAQGMEYGTQNSVFVNGFDDTVTLGSAMSRHDSPAVAQALNLVKKTDEGVFEIVKLVQKIHRITGDKRRGFDTSEIVDAKEQAYDELDSIVREYLRDFSEEKDPIAYTNIYAQRIYQCLLQIGTNLLNAVEMSRFITHGPDPDHPMYLPQAARQFRQKLLSILSIDQSNKVEEGER